MRETITKEDFEFLKSETQNLKLKIQKLSKELGEAAKNSSSFVDHNPEYKAISDEIKPLKERVANLESLAGKLSVASLGKLDDKEITPYSLITIEDMDMGITERYYLIYPFLSDKYEVIEGVTFISPKSPIGKALMNKKKNDIVEISLPAKTKRIKIFDTEIVDYNKLKS